MEIDWIDFYTENEKETDFDAYYEHLAEESDRLYQDNLEEEY